MTSQNRNYVNLKYLSRTHSTRYIFLLERLCTALIKILLPISCKSEVDIKIQQTEAAIVLHL